MDRFHSKNEWQLRMRNRFLPFYYRREFSEYEFIKYGDARAEGGVDTIADGKRIDEKIVQWPKPPRDTPYDAYTLEEWSCTVPDRISPGWMMTNEVEFLLYCFASKDEQELICHLLDFGELWKWFWPRVESWPKWISDEINRTQCRVVPFWEVHATVPCKITTISIADESVSILFRREGYSIMELADANEGCGLAS